MAGEVLGHLSARKTTDPCRCKHLVDAVVMAFAARMGDVVYTGDMEDLMALQAFFPAVRVLAV